MPTIITHAVVPLCIAVAMGPRRISRKVALLGGLLAMVPDLDVVGLRLGVAYADQWGHRGATHSLLAAGMITGLIAVVWPAMRRGWNALFLFVSMASHGLLDTLTSGGLGAALLWPLNTARYFAPWRPIRVSPIGSRFFTARGLETVYSELLWVWVPCGLLALGGYFYWRRRAVHLARADA
ncbi:MAG: metal-dependent hydrolase [Sphingomonas sp.]